MNITRLLDAETEVLSLTDVKNQLRITGTDDDDALRYFIAGIRQKTEQYLGQTLVTSTWEYKLDKFPDEISLPMYPIQSITSIEYIDADGIEQTFSDIQYDKAGRLKPSYGNLWPATRDQYDAVTVTYVAGNTHAGNVTQDVKLAMLLWVGSCDLNRENVLIGTSIVDIPDGAKALLNPYRRLML